jgi:hypothetical protein
MFVAALHRGLRGWSLKWMQVLRTAARSRRIARPVLTRLGYRVLRLQASLVERRLDEALRLIRAALAP